MFVDELKIRLSAGRGGNGVVRWRHEKGKEFSGPGGGDGGRGGNVSLRAVRDLGALLRYRHVKEIKAEDGADGVKNGMHGKDGLETVVDLPIGSVVESKEMGRRVELLKEGETVTILHGGRGGFGNEHFKSSTNTTPREFTLGENGEEGNFRIELKLIADVGLVGLPNAGKSSLLNALTNAKAKVADYPFTTLEPNLGDLYGFVLADIPGLIEGASLGRGLGFKFLRHINRTRVLLHCVSLEDDISASYLTVREELRSYGEGLLDKPEIILLTKSDLVPGEDLKEKVAEAERFGGEVWTVSILDDSSVKKLGERLVEYLRKG